MAGGQATSGGRDLGEEMGLLGGTPGNRLPMWQQEAARDAACAGINPEFK